jgi:hypothetical protein
MQRMHVLLLGDFQHREFCDAVEWLDRHADLHKIETVDDALSQLSQCAIAPEIIVIAQSRPGQFTQSAIERLHKASPLSRLVALLGSWCEGETRTGQPWPGVIRVYWHQWLPRCADELQRLSAGRRAAWNLPRTVADSEQLLYASAQSRPPRAGLIAIHAGRFAAYDALSDACQTAGYSTVWLAPHQPHHVHGAAAIIYDGTSCDRAEAERLSSLAAMHKPAPIVALLAFPRLEDRDRALQAGAAAVVSKPFLLTDLWWQIEQLIGRTSDADTTSAAA